MYLIYAFVLAIILFDTYVNSNQEYSVSIGLKCNTSEQCNKFDENSLCFASDNQFKEWVCLCKHEFYYDKNFTQKCLKKFDFGIKCNTSDQCLGENSICDHKYRCNCPQNYYFVDISNECKNNESLKCSETEEWNQFINKCQTKVHYSHRGGGGGASGGGGRSRGRGGGRSGSIGGGRSWWYTSWFLTRSSGSYGGHGGVSKSDGNESLALDKLIFVITAVCAVTVGLIYYCYSIRIRKSTTKPSNRSKKAVDIPVTKGADDVSLPLNNNQTKQDLWIEHHGPNSDQILRSVPTSSYTESKKSCDDPFTSSPPPPYNSRNSSLTLPFSPLSNEPWPQPRTQSSDHSTAAHSSYNSFRKLTLTSEITTNPNTAEITVRHPSNPNQILPFASAIPLI